MAETLTAGEALIALRADASQLSKDMQAATATVVTQLQKIEENTKSVGLAALAKQVEEFARATATAQKDVTALKFAAIADEVNSLTSAFKGAEDGVRVSEDLAAAEKLLEERFAMVRAEIERQATAQRGLIDEETLLERTTLQLEAAQRQHETALATVRGRALQAAEGIASLADEEQASALAAEKAWEAVGLLAIEQEKAEQSARALADQEAKLAADTERSAAMAQASKEAWSGAQIAFGLVSKAIVGVVGALAAAEAAAVALTVRTVEQGDELNRLSAQYGVAVETLAGMKQAFKDNNLEASDLNAALRQFSNVLGEAMSGSEKASATVAALGIDVAKLKDGTLSTEDAFRLAIDALAGMENGYGKAAISQDVFGRAGSKIPGIFKDGAKSIDEATSAAEKMGNSFNKLEQQAVAQLDDAMDELSNRVSGLGASIGKELMPVAEDIVRQANEWIEANRSLITQDVKGFVSGIRDAMNSLLPVIKAVTSGLRAVGEIVAGFSGPLKGSFAALAAEEARLVEESKRAANVFRVMHPLTKTLGDSTDYIGNRYNALQAELAVVRSRMAAMKDPTLQAAESMADLGRVTEEEANAAIEAAKANDKLPPPIIATGDAAKSTSESLASATQGIVDLRDESQKLTTVILKTGQSIEVTDDQLAAIRRGLKASEDGTADAQTAWLRYIPAVEDAGVATEDTTDALGEIGPAADEASASLVKLEGISSDLAKGLAQTITGSADWRGVGDAILAQTIDETFAKGLENALNETFIKSIKEAIDPVSKAMEEMFKSAFNYVAEGMKALAKPAIDALSGALSSGIAAIGASAGVVGAIAAGVAGIGVGIAAAFGAFDGPDMQHKISRVIAKLLKKSLNAPEVHDAIDAALVEMGFEFTTGIERILTQTPISGAEVRAVWAEGGEAAGESYSAGFQKFLASEGNGINNLAASDLINLYFPGLDAAGEAAATEAAKAAGAAAAALQGLTGPDALIFAEQFGASLANVAHVLGMTEDEFLSFVQSVAGEGAVAFAAGLDELNGAAVEALGQDGFSGLLSDVEKHMETVFGVKNIDAGNLLDVFIQSGASAEAFAAQLERMAESNPDLKRLIDNLDPPLVDALSAVEDGGNAAAKAIGKLTGQANTSLAGVEARIYAFGEALYTVADDGSKQLSTLGEELNSELVAGISGIEDAIKEEVNSAAGLTSETLGAAFAELKALAALPAEALDASTTDAIDHLKAVIQAATGWTAEQIDTMIATAADVPPPIAAVPPETTASLDGAAESTGEIATNSAEAATATDDLSASVDSLTAGVATLADGPSVTEALGLTPDSAAAINGAAGSLNIALAATTDLTGSIESLAAGVTSSTDEFSALADVAGLSSEQIKAALAGVIGTVDDETGLLAVEDIVAERIPEALLVAQDATLGATGVIHDSFDYARGAVLMLTDAINAIPDKTVTITVNQVGGTDVTTSTPLPGGATGGWIPGAVGEPFPMVAHGGEFIIPADIAQRVVGGGTAPMMATRSADPASTSSASPDWVAVPVRRKDLAEGAVLELARATQTGRAHVEGRQIHVSPTYGRRR